MNVFLHHELFSLLEPALKRICRTSPVRTRRSVTAKSQFRARWYAGVISAWDRRQTGTTCFATFPVQVSLNFAAHRSARCFEADGAVEVSFPTTQQLAQRVSSRNPFPPEVASLVCCLQFQGSWLLLFWQGFNLAQDASLSQRLCSFAFVSG